MRISVIIPAYNEEAIIEQNLRAVQAFMRKNFDDFELILINDGSLDKTAEKACLVDGVRVISYPQNKGKGHAVKTGVMDASGDYIVFTDADLAYSPNYIADCVQVLQSDADIAIGSRYTFSDNCENYSVSRRLASQLFVRFANFMLKLNLTDIQCGIKGFRANTAKNIFDKMTVNGFGFDVEILHIAKKMNYCIREFAVEMQRAQTSKVRVVRDALKMFMNVITIRQRRYKIYDKN